MQKLILLSCYLLILVNLSFAQVDTAIIPQKTTSPVPDSFQVAGKSMIGMAATYSSKADGSRTTSGDLFYNAQATAASNQFPLGTWVKVTHIKNGKWALVRINDRTSKKKSAPIVQLSRSVVAKLGFLRTGNAKVKLEKIIVNNYKSNNNDSILVLPTIAPITDTVQTDKPGYIIKGKSVNGIASFYSSNLDGTLTATGERYRNNKLTAASNNFPLNTWVKVTSLFNGKSVVLRINDRMHPRMKKKGRVVDLSRAAANQLDFIARGITKVKVETIIWLKNDSTLKEQRDTLPAVTDSLINRVDSSQITNDSTTQTISDTKTSLEKENGTLTGIASFYSSNLDGTKTATGEIFRNKKMTAASNQFPLNSWVRVTNLKNGRSVIVRINDRMHPRMKAKGRVVDLSRTAAQKLGFLKSGLTRVKVERVKKGTLN
jgi:rare lipoprotein A